jgi:hypothetical protein
VVRIFEALGRLHTVRYRLEGLLGVAEAPKMFRPVWSA